MSEGRVSRVAVLLKISSASMVRNMVRMNGHRYFPPPIELLDVVLR